MFVSKENEEKDNLLDASKTHHTHFMKFITSQYHLTFSPSNKSYPALKRVGLFVFAHLCGTDGPDTRLYRVTFRQLDRQGTGAISAQDLVIAIRERGLAVPDDFEVIYRAIFLDKGPTFLCFY